MCCDEHGMVLKLRTLYQTLINAMETLYSLGALDEVSFPTLLLTLARSCGQY